MQTGKMRPEIETVVQNMERAIVGKREVIVLVLTALLAEGHVLMEDVPGVGKTKLAASLAASCRGTFSRIQMTPDVMPSDITGFHMLQGLDGKREFKRGAAFCNILLADEINRASAKSQSALLEIMEENQISIDGITYQLEKPFMVIATQNPVETYGTYHLPEAQMDRFMCKLSIVDIVEATRSLPGVRLGVSPRGSIALYRSAQAYAYLQGRDYILPDDIKYLAPFCLGHRLLLLPGKTRSGDSVREQVLEQVPVPVK